MNNISLLCRTESLIDRRQRWQVINLDVYSPSTLKDEIAAIDRYRDRVLAKLAQRDKQVSEMIEQLKNENQLEY